MPNVSPGNSNPLGTTTTPDKYPQWGAKKIASTGDSTKDYSFIEAKSASDKATDLNNGYLVWFDSLAAAQKYAASQDTPFLNGSVPIPNVAKWLASITGISGKNLVLRGVKVVFGAVLMLLGFSRITGAKLPRVVPI